MDKLSGSDINPLDSAQTILDPNKHKKHHPKEDEKEEEKKKKTDSYEPSNDNNYKNNTQEERVKSDKAHEEGKGDIIDYTI